MASGTPVIVSDICGVSEVIKELGFGRLVSPFGKNGKKVCKNWYEKISGAGIQADYVDQLKDAILDSLPYNWEEQSSRVSRELSEKYSIQACANQYKRLYELLALRYFFEKFRERSRHLRMQRRKAHEMEFLIS